MDHQIEFLLLGERGVPRFTTIGTDMLHALCQLRKLLTKVLVHLHVGAVQRLAGLNALEQVPQMRGIASEIVGIAVNDDAKITLDDLSDIF